ncbi:regulatory protein YcgZ [Kosakonia pseudosacchari]|uniref:Two-component-system connector protein YcgZ n=1 Tax=Kosakonia pseudosacchari TaxID=1646340 RepID=A0ABX4IVU1_9ENTR|nr:regulatory protein YcgZ [Kosakonia pseudosacchari]PDO90429.1 two-component-system connector protein YcgZ [Kosakonia pseudosacchari]QOV62154.1 two-component-system connector protein YcgZ [Kosakonia pseudosacchari]WBU51312.1 regulatory protein YcgZ [Kosakonia pseudosacchari]
MQQNSFLPNTANAVTRYFDKATLPTQQETLGRIAVEILTEGRNLNRKAICTKLLSRLEKASGPEEESHYHTLIGLLFDR